jgi:outer membrane lipoprotein-sorting protein
MRLQRCTSLGPALRIIALLLIALLLVACSRKSAHEQLADEITRELSRVQTLQGTLQITLRSVTLDQELWVQLPRSLRTETEAGPGAFLGTIVVLNEQEGWVYNPGLGVATVVDRAGYTPELAGEAGAGSALERLPYQVLDLVTRQTPFVDHGQERIAGRHADHLEFALAQDIDVFPAGPLHVWLDRQFSYPLAVTDSSGKQIRFTSILFNPSINPITFTFTPPPSAVVRRVNPQSTTQD